MDCLQEDDELVFLYQLVKGQTSTSYACQVAAAMGLPPAVVARGAQVTDLISRNRPIPKMNAEGMEKQQKVYGMESWHFKQRCLCIVLI